MDNTQVKDLLNNQTFVSGLKQLVDNVNRDNFLHDKMKQLKKLVQEKNTEMNKQSQQITCERILRDSFMFDLFRFENHQIVNYGNKNIYFTGDIYKLPSVIKNEKLQQSGFLNEIIEYAKGHFKERHIDFLVKNNLFQFHIPEDKYTNYYDTLIDAVKNHDFSNESVMCFDIIKLHPELASCKHTQHLRKMIKIIYSNIVSNVGLRIVDITDFNDTCRIKIYLR